MDKKLKEFINRDNCYFIHYASDGFYNGFSPAPKISCIDIYNLKNNADYSFCIKDYLKNNSGEEAEKIILENFKVFLDKTPDICFIHWGMEANGFGFKAIQARAKELGTDLPMPRYLFDLSSYVAYLSEKRLSIKQILWFNSLLYSGDYLDGKAEAEYFKAGKFEEIYHSVYLKVHGFAEIVKLIRNNNLKVDAPYRNDNGLTSKEKLQLSHKIARKRIQMLDEIYEHNEKIMDINESFIEERQAKFDFVDGILDLLRLFILFKNI